MKDLEGQEKDGMKRLEKKKKEIEKLISENERTEREKIENPFISEINELEKKKKEILEERSSAKKAKIEEEIKQQTGDWNDIKSEQKKKIRKLAQEDRISRFGISELFFAFYYPKAWKDILVLLIGLLFVFLLIPFACYRLFWEDGGKFAVVSIYLVVTIIFGLLYIWINNTIKEKHLETFQKINMLRGEAKEAKQNIKNKIQQIEKKSDAELLGEEQSEQYENMLKELEWQIKYQKDEKEKNLKGFDQDINAKEERAQKIWLENKPELDIMQTDINETQRKKEGEKIQVDDIREKLGAEIYKPLQELEKNIFKEKVLDELIEYIGSGEVKNIGAAIEKRKNPKGTV